MRQAKSTSLMELLTALVMLGLPDYIAMLGLEPKNAPIKRGKLLLAPLAYVGCLWLLPPVCSGFSASIGRDRPLIKLDNMNFIVISFGQRRR
jgi:hypothetical protein